MDEELKISGVVDGSIVDGPGIRYTIFTQGCPHKCEGCHNPQTHDIKNGYSMKVGDIIKEIENDPLLKGITISGGEPFIQAKKLSKLIENINNKKLDIIAYTGFVFEDLLKRSNEENGYVELLKKVDILMDGKFDISKKAEKLLFRGSYNQRAIDVKESLKINRVVEYQF